MPCFKKVHPFGSHNDYVRSWPILIVFGKNVAEKHLNWFSFHIVIMKVIGVNFFWNSADVIFDTHSVIQKSVLVVLCYLLKIYDFRMKKWILRIESNWWFITELCDTLWVPMEEEEFA